MIVNNIKKNSFGGLASLLSKDFGALFMHKIRDES